MTKLPVFRSTCIRSSSSFTTVLSEDAKGASDESSVNNEDITTKPSWKAPPLDDTRFEWMRRLLAAPSPVGFEASMTEGVLRPYFDGFMPPGWAFRTFKGNAGAVVDTDPNDKGSKLKVMVIGHADKIRMQVRHITSDGKVYINSDSFLPSTLIGNQVICFSRKPQPEQGDSTTDLPTQYQKIHGTVEALGAIHFAPASHRTGKAGVKPEDLYLELGIYGKDGKKQVEDLGIRAGDCVILDRPITRCVGKDTFSGAYLDNGLGCFVAAELAKELALGSDANVFDHVRGMFAFASHEEIGRFGSRVLAAELKPDVLIAVDVNHDYDAAPIGKNQKHPPLKMGSGFTITNGNIASPALNDLIEQAASLEGIPFQRDVRGRDSGTDAMAGVLGNVDCAATSLGFPIRNMHTISELGHTGDVLATIAALKRTFIEMAKTKTNADSLRTGHPRLDFASSDPVTTSAS